MEQTNFVFIGNHFATDFVNSRKNVKGQRTELLHSWEDLMKWLDRSGKRDVITGDLEQLPAAERMNLFQKTLAFRGKLEQAFITIVEERAVPVLFIADLNDELSRYRSYYQIKEKENGITTKRFYDISQLPALFLEEAALFLTTFKPDNLKKCENHKCILFFYDTSRNQQRRWCSMERCGNRVKVNQHYHRHKSATEEA
ncbi:CGNR zinc finger domain-containing protein [Paenibacillus andongensis]|uniref:CGNR zinc finger domain-containing protein n=1 Tax=Paenibacillus andongensis TaxID=2975482 RepID=UPI0021BB1467|nr:CGNR zinc finger domain-containing protein [Paenibacillus andongensis]